MGRSRDLVVDPIAPTSIWFPRIRLRTTPASHSFHELVGFLPVDEPETTHANRLR
jgi:hypothetical protein